MAIPGEPVFDAETGDQLRDADGQGRRQRALPHRRPTSTPSTRSSRPAASPFDAPPTEQPWGIDSAFRDPSGNNFRLAQLAEVPAAV